MMRRAALVLVLTSACFSGASVGGRVYTPISQEAPSGVSDKDLYASTIRIFTDAGWGVLEKDADAGIVTSKFINAGVADGMTTSNVFHAWRIRIAEGNVRVEIGCMMVDMMPGQYNQGMKPCHSDERRPEFIDGAPKLAQRIISDAQMRAARRKERAAEEVSEE